MKCFEQDEVVDDGESDKAEHVDEENVGTIDGVLPVLRAHGAVCAHQDAV